MAGMTIVPRPLSECPDVPVISVTQDLDYFELITAKNIIPVQYNTLYTASQSLHVHVHVQILHSPKQL